jgi:transcription antitermination protein NusB
MGTRRNGREAAVQHLYQLDLNERDLQSADAFWALRSAAVKAETAADLRAFADGIVAGVTEHLAEIDERIKKYAVNYELHRLAAVDRNILRVAIYEMLFCPEIAPAISINEAIEIAKRYGSDESGRFVNGILDRVRMEVARGPRESTWEPGKGRS